jgi:DNA-binding transcriptional MerR regulator
VAEKASASGAAHDATVETKSLAQIAQETGLTIDQLKALVERDRHEQVERYTAGLVERLEAKLEKQRQHVADTEAALAEARAAAQEV